MEDDNSGTLSYLGIYERLRQIRVREFSRDYESLASTLARKVKLNMSVDLMSLSGRVATYVATLVSIKDLATLSDREIDILNAVVEHQIMTNPNITDILKREVSRVMNELGDSTK